MIYMGGKSKKDTQPEATQDNEIDCYLGICHHFTKEQEKICWWSQEYNKVRKADPHQLEDWENAVFVKSKQAIEAYVIKKQIERLDKLAHFGDDRFKTDVYDLVKEMKRQKADLTKQLEALTGEGNG